MRFEIIDFRDHDTREHRASPDLLPVDPVTADAIRAALCLQRYQREQDARELAAS